MTRHALSAPLIYDGYRYHHNKVIVAENGYILGIEEHAPLDAILTTFDEGMLIPGFIDLQVNDGGGVLFNNTPNLNTLKIMLNAHLSLGTHAILPTIITSDDSTLLNAIGAVKEGIEQNLEGLLGIHLEGPMINPNRRGIHFSEFIHILDKKILSELAHKSLGTVLVTLAPETVPNSLIKELVDAGIIVFAGHTEATPDQLNLAFEAGLSGFTHIYNAMPPMLSRDPSVVGTALTSLHTWGTLINDGIHVHPMMAKIAIQSKTPDRIILITDSMATIGSDLLSFDFNHETISLNSAKTKLLNHENKLAGAHLNLLSAIHNTQALGYDFEVSLMMATLNPAKALHKEDELGHLQIGSKAYINYYNKNSISSINLFKNLTI